MFLSSGQWNVGRRYIHHFGTWPINSFYIQSFSFCGLNGKAQWGPRRWWSHKLERTWVMSDYENGNLSIRNIHIGFVYTINRWGFFVIFSCWEVGIRFVIITSIYILIEYYFLLVYGQVIYNSLRKLKPPEANSLHFPSLNNLLTLVPIFSFFSFVTVEWLALLVSKDSHSANVLCSILFKELWPLT